MLVVQFPALDDEEGSLDEDDEGVEEEHKRGGDIEAREERVEGEYGEVDEEEVLE